MTETVGIRVDAEKRKVWNRFKNAIIRKYGKLHGVFSKEVMSAIEARLAILEAESHTQIPDKNFSSFHRRLAHIFNDLPNGGSFDRVHLERVIEKHAGGDQRTLLKYQHSLIALDMIVQDGWRFKRGIECDWIKLAGEEK
jgi:predicted secreted Zn-dependent protease